MCCMSIPLGKLLKVYAFKLWVYKQFRETMGLHTIQRP